MTFSPNSRLLTKPVLFSKTTNMKLFVCSLLFICLTSAASAQWQFGARLGPNFSTISFTSDGYSTGYVPGLALGGFARYALTDDIDLQGGLLFSFEGNSWTFEPLDRDGKIRSSQIRVPLLLQYKISEQFFVSGGPQARLLLNMTQKIEGADKTNLTDFYKRLTPAFQIGGGYRFGGNMTGLDIDIHYFSDLSSLAKESVDGGKLRGSGILLTLGWVLGRQ